MCGLVAILGAPTDRMNAALERLAHRGPDGRGIWSSNQISLGHTRLAIRDRAHGQQPLVSADGERVAVVNGEIYGPLRDRLIARGHHFQTRSDSELVLHAYQAFGDDCVEHFSGELAFVLWDQRRQRLLAARDRFGIKPLFWAQVGRTVYLASEAKALFALGVPAYWDPRSVRHVVRNQYLPPTRSYFAGIQMVPPATALVIEEGRMRWRRYWSPPESVDTISEADAAEQVAEQLSRAVQERLDSEVPVAFSLSGGLDSSGVLALARGHSAFAVRFPKQGFDEAAEARQVADHLGATLTVVEATPEALWAALPSSVYFAEGLTINGQLPAKYLLAQQIRASGAKVVLSGEGADEAFLGYPHLLQDLATDLVSLRIQDPGAAMVMVADARAQVPRVAKFLGGVPSFLSAKIGLCAPLGPLLVDALQSDEDPLCWVDEELAACQSMPSLVRRSAWLWSRWALAGYILRTLGDGTEMAHGVEGRTPYLDHQLFERAWTLPPNLLFDHRFEKRTLRLALGGRLPESILGRPKHPFVAPPLADPEAPFWPEIEARLREQCAQPFERARVGRWLDHYKAAPREAQVRQDPALMLLLSASMLEQHFALTLPA